LGPVQSQRAMMPATDRSRMPGEDSPSPGRLDSGSIAAPYLRARFPCFRNGPGARFPGPTALPGRPMRAACWPRYPKSQNARVPGPSSRPRTHVVRAGATGPPGSTIPIPKRSPDALDAAGRGAAPLARPRARRRPDVRPASHSRPVSLGSKSATGPPWRTRDSGARRRRPGGVRTP
jgi:hypothetical protein